MSAVASLAVVPLSKCRLGQYNPRKTFSDESQGELENSIREHGILVPLILRVIPDGFEVVAGERRFRIASKLLIPEIPAVVRELDDVQALEIAILENLQREDVLPIEEAEGFAKLIETGAYTVDTLAARLGKSRSHVYGRLQLRNLAPEVVEAVGQGFLASSATQAVVGLSGPEQAKLVSAALSANPGKPVSARQFKSYVKKASEERWQKTVERERKQAAKRDLGQKEARKQEREFQAARKRRLAWCETLVPEFRKVLKNCDEREFLGRYLVCDAFHHSFPSQWPLQAERKPDAAAVTEWTGWKLLEQRAWLLFGHDAVKLGERDLERVACFLGVEMPVEPSETEPPKPQKKSKRVEAQQIELEGVK